MLTWEDIENFVKTGTPAADKRIVKTGEQWKKLLNEDVYWVTREAGTERPFSSPMCSHFEPGKYVCACSNSCPRYSIY